MASPLHRKIGKWINQEIGKPYFVRRDPACGGKQHIPLFCNEKKSSGNRLCNVDLLIHNGSKVLVVVEIEESNVKPTQICGKFFTTAFSKFHVHKNDENKPIGVDGSFLFIQVVDTKNLKKKTKKFEQWGILEGKVKGLLKKANNKIKYILINTCKEDYKSSHLIDLVNDFLESHK